MAAGKGTRLRPFTDNNPKPLIKVGGISLIERNILKLKEHNISEVIINLHHFGEKIIDLLGEGSNYGLKISYSLEKDLLGTGGGICNSIHHFDDPFIVLSSDTWTDFDFNKFFCHLNFKIKTRFPERTEELNFWTSIHYHFKTCFLSKVSCFMINHTNLSP